MVHIFQFCGCFLEGRGAKFTHMLVKMESTRNGSYNDLCVPLSASHCQCSSSCCAAVWDEHAHIVIDILWKFVFHPIPTQQVLVLWQFAPEKRLTTEKDGCPWFETHTHIPRVEIIFIFSSLLFCIAFTDDKTDFGSWKPQYQSSFALQQRRRAEQQGGVNRCWCSAGEEQKEKVVVPLA